MPQAWCILYTNISISNMYSWNVFFSFQQQEQWLFNIFFHFTLHNFNFNKQPKHYSYTTHIEIQSKWEHFFPAISMWLAYFYGLKHVRCTMRINTLTVLNLIWVCECDFLFQNKLMNESVGKHSWCWRDDSNLLFRTHRINKMKSWKRMFFINNKLDKLQMG